MHHDGNANDDGRDVRGRFVEGNRGARGHGGSRARARLARALHAAVDEGAIEKIGIDLLAIAADAALEPGARIAAMRLLLEHAVGRPREADAGVAVALPAVRSAGDVVEGIARTFEALSSGDVDAVTASRLVDALRSAGDAIAWGEIERRIAELERKS